MNKLLKYGIVIIVVLLSYGFALVSTSVVLKNNISFAVNNLDFDVYFSYAFPEINGSTTISQDKHSVTYNTKQLHNVGDTAVLDLYITNNSSQYDVDVKLLVQALNNNYSSYYTITYEDLTITDYTTIDAKKTMKGTLTITVTQTLPSSVSLGFTIGMDMNKLERTDYGQVRVYNAEEVEYTHGNNIHNVKEALDDLRNKLR